MITDKQYNILVNFMEFHSDFARDARNKNRYRLWNELTCELNQAGGGEPLSTKNWANTWSMMKRNVRIQFTKYLNKGKIESLKLTPLENRIKNILRLSEEKIQRSILKQTKVVHKSVESYYATLYKQNKSKLGKKTMTIAERLKISNEAHQSWKNMPAKMKQKIILKHKHARDLRFYKIADYLKDSKLSESPVKPRSSLCVMNEGDSLVDNIAKDVGETDMLEENNPKETEDSINNLSSPRPHDELKSPPPPPPPPPPVVTAEALYALIQSSSQIENIPWISLPEAEKRQFRKAVICLKKDYLRQYRCYLHNLPSIDLHRHMVQTIFNGIV